jgi:hypothetical protein
VVLIDRAQAVVAVCDDDPPVLLTADEEDGGEVDALADFLLILFHVGVTHS